jgi:putative MATE family efflux protein
MNRNLNMTKGHPANLLIRFALPLMFGNIFQQLYTVVDTAIVGKGVGMEALAALGTVDWLNWMFLAIAQGFTQGFAVRMSQKFGEGDSEGLKRSIGISAKLSAYIAIVSLIVALSGLPLFLKLLRVPENLMPYASIYSGIILAGVPAMMFYNYCASVLRAVGDSKTPLIAMIIASIANIALDCIAVFALKWGIAGAAIATVLAQVLAGAVCMVKMLRSPQLRFEKRHMAKDPALVKALMALGAPLAAQFVIIAVGGMAVQSVVNRFETSFIAGFTATNKLYGILEIAAVSYGFAVTTYTGQNFGAARWDRIRKGTNWAVLLSVLTAMLIAAVMILFGRNITMLFIESDIQALEIAAGNVAYRYLCFMSLALPILYLLHVYRAALQGVGNAQIPLWSGIAEFVIRVGASVVVGMTLWQDGIFWGEVGAWVGAAILLATAYYRIASKLGK